MPVLWALIGCVAPLPEPTPEPTEPECSLFTLASACASFVGDCHECSSSSTRWFECDDGWTSNTTDIEQAVAEFTCHCDGNGCWQG